MPRSTSPTDLRAARPRRPRAVRVPRVVLAAIAAVAALGSGCTPAPPPPAERIVLVTIDTLRADRVGAYGDASAHTPTLDGLAAAGVRFEHAIAPTPLTLPSHTSLFTGLDPHQHGVRVNGRFTLSDAIPTVAEHLNEAGYATAAFVASFVLDARFGLARGFDVYDDRMGGPASDAALSVAERKADAVVDAARDWLDRAPERFFLWVHLYDPHADYVPPAEHRALAGDDPYAGEVSFADAEVARLLGAVQRRFGRERLLVVVTSDHGEALGQHGEPTHGHGLYDTTQRVPLVVFGHGVPRGRVVEAPVRLLDVGPTLLARAGAAPLPDAKGADLTPWMEGRTDEPRPAYLETLRTQVAYGWSPLLGLRTATHKYVRAPRPELYDLRVDPDEEHDLAEAEPARVAELDAALDAVLAEPRFGADATELDADERRRLEALGYVGAGAAAPAASELGVVGGPNPRDRVHEVLLMMRAALEVGQGRGVDALQTLRAVQTREGEHYHRLRGQAALVAQDAAVARESAAALEALGRDADAHWYRAMAAFFDGDAAAARRHLEAVLELGPERTIAAVNLGRLDEAEGDLEAAAERYAWAVEREPEDPVARAHLVALRLGQGRTAEADALLAGHEAALAEDVAATLRVAAAERAAGREARAQAHLRAALARRPGLAVLEQALADGPARTGAPDGLETGP